VDITTPGSSEKQKPSKETEMRQWISKVDNSLLVFRHLKFWVIQSILTTICGIMFSIWHSRVYPQHYHPVENSQGFLSSQNASLVVALIMATSVLQRMLDPLRGDADPSISAALIVVKTLCFVSHFFMYINVPGPFRTVFGRDAFMMRYVQWNSLFPLISAIVEYTDFNQQHSFREISQQSMGVLLGSFASVLSAQGLQHYAILVVIFSHVLFLHGFMGIKRRFSNFWAIREKVNNSSIQVNEDMGSHYEKVWRTLMLSCILCVENLCYCTVHILGLVGCVSNETENVTYAFLDIILKAVFSCKTEN
jgi:bacteriorhodopsin